MKPEAGMLVFSKAANMASPDTMPGHPPPALKAAMPALLAAKVLVSCSKPATMMRMAAVLRGSGAAGCYRFKGPEVFEVPVCTRCRTDQFTGIGFARSGKHFMWRALFDNAPVLHDDDLVGNLRGHP